MKGQPLNVLVPGSWQDCSLLCGEYLKEDFLVYWLLNFLIFLLIEFVLPILAFIFGSFPSFLL